MGKKGKKKGKKGGKKGGKKSAAAEETKDEPPAYVDEEEYITLDMKLINWAYMDFQVRVKTTTYLFQIKDEIKSRHGRVTDVVLYRDHVDDDNKLMNDMATFEDMQFKGGLATEDPVGYHLMEEVSSRVVTGESEAARLWAALELGERAAQPLLTRLPREATWFPRGQAVAVLSAAHPSLALAKEAALHIKNRPAAGVVAKLMESSLVSAPSASSGPDYLIFKDAASSRPYFVSASTGESSWECPVDLPLQQFSDKTVSAARAASEASGDESSLWGVFLDPETHVPFFHNLISSESQWEVPVELQSLPVLQSAMLDEEDDDAGDSEGKTMDQGETKAGTTGKGKGGPKGGDEQDGAREAEKQQEQEQEMDEDQKWAQKMQQGMPQDAAGWSRRINRSDERVREALAMYLSRRTGTVNECAALVARSAGLFVSLCRDHPRASKGALQIVRNMCRDPSLRENLCVAGAGEALVGRSMTVLCQLRFARDAVNERAKCAQDMAEVASAALAKEKASREAVTAAAQAARCGTSETKRALKSAKRTSSRDRKALAAAEANAAAAARLVGLADKKAAKMGSLLGDVLAALASAVDKHRPSQRLVRDAGLCKSLLEILQQEVSLSAVAIAAIGASANENTVVQDELEGLGSLVLLLARLGDAAGQCHSATSRKAAHRGAEDAATIADALGKCVRHNAHCSLQLCELGAMDILIDMLNADTSAAFLEDDDDSGGGAGTGSDGQGEYTEADEDRMAITAATLIGECAAATGEVRRILAERGLAEICGTALLGMLESGRPPATTASTYALQNLVDGHNAISEVLHRRGGLSLLGEVFLQPVLAVDGSWTEAICSTARCLKTIVTSNDAMKDAVRLEGILEVLIGTLESCGRPRRVLEETASVVGVRREITACLACAAAGCRANQDELRVLGAVPLAIALVNGGSKMTQIEAANLITQLARDNVDSKIVLRQNGATKALATVLRVGSDLAKQYVCQTLSVIMTDDPEAKFDVLRWNGLAGLIEMIRESSLELGRANAADAWIGAFPVWTTKRCGGYFE
eukprot:g315.t1